MNANMERDKFLIEKMGECWHLFPIHAKVNTVGGTQCAKCGKWYDVEECNNLSTWKAFGKLWDWGQEQTWWESFAFRNTGHNSFYVGGIVNPNRFATAVYAYFHIKPLFEDE